MFTRKRKGEISLSLLVFVLGCLAIYDRLPEATKASIGNWSDWGSVLDYWYIPIIVIVSAVLIYFSRRIIRKIKHWIALIKVLVVFLQAAAAAKNQPTAPPVPAPPAPPVTPPAPPAPAPPAPPVTPPAPPTPAQPAPPAPCQEENPWTVRLVIFMLLIIIGLVIGMCYLALQNFDQQAEIARLKEDNNLNIQIIKKQESILREFNVPAPVLKTEQQIAQTDLQKLFIGSICDYSQNQYPLVVAKYLKLVNKNSLEEACTVPAQTIPPATTGVQPATTAVAPAPVANTAPAPAAPLPPKPTASPAAPVASTPAAVPAPAPAATPSPKPESKPKGTAENPYGTRASSQRVYVPEGAQETSNGNESSGGTVYLDDDPNPPKQENNTDGNTVYFQ